MDTLAADGVTGFTTRRVAQAARTSTPAVYELFGDRAGLVREMFFQAFRQLGERFDQLDATDDPRQDLAEVIGALRGFVVDHPALGQLMFSRPFSRPAKRPTSRDMDPNVPGAVTVSRCFLVVSGSACCRTSQARRRQSWRRIARPPTTRHAR